jgi:hypothetical protein
MSDKRQDLANRSDKSVDAAASDIVTVQNNRGPLANAWFSWLDPSGCIETDTFVTANRPTNQQLPGRGTTTGIAAVSIFEYDACTDTVLLDAVGENDAVPVAAFQVSNQLIRRRSQPPSPSPTSTRARRSTPRWMSPGRARVASSGTTTTRRTSM